MSSKMKALIEIGEEGIYIRPGMEYPEYLQIMCSAQLGMMKSVLMRAKENPDNGEEFLIQLEKDLYDSFNRAASNVLSLFAPDLELRPDLTTDAILAAENALLDEKIAEGEIQAAADLAGFNPEPAQLDPVSVEIVERCKKPAKSNVIQGNFVEVPEETPPEE